MNGLIHPIRRHVGDPKVEDAAFKLKEGEVSPVIEVMGQFAILKCEGQTPPTGFTKDQVRGKLEEFVREKKLRTVSADVFKKLQDESQIVNVYNDPQKQAQNPGVAATINGKTITIRELSEECISRHGEQVLEQMINRKLLEVELKKRNLKVTPEEMDAEIARAALSAGRITKDGKPDVEAWMKTVLEDQKISRDKYIKDSVWPSTALKLIAGDVKVTDEDIQKGFKANFGQRAQVRRHRAAIASAALRKPGNRPAITRVSNTSANSPSSIRSSPPAAPTKAASPQSSNTAVSPSWKKKPSYSNPAKSPASFRS